MNGVLPSCLQSYLNHYNHGEYQTRSACKNKMKTLMKNQTILSFIKPKENSVFEIHDIKGLKLLTRLRLNFSHLNEHKIRHGFKDRVDPMCKCGVETETTPHFLLRCRLLEGQAIIQLLEQDPWTIYILLLHPLRITLMKNF